MKGQTLTRNFHYEGDSRASFHFSHNTAVPTGNAGKMRSCPVSECAPVRESHEGLYEHLIDLSTILGALWPRLSPPRMRKLPALDRRASLLGRVAPAATETSKYLTPLSPRQVAVLCDFRAAILCGPHTPTSPLHWHQNQVGQSRKCVETFMEGLSYFYAVGTWSRPTTKNVTGDSIYTESHKNIFVECDLKRTPPSALSASLETAT